ncbi:prepilin-type N-terminal cleavage/methylation domain-containing protein [Vallitalea okinawensis]|uniref:prepilin-type N-terminal cleavage/methylation domain-containing protein n=1 Tax=Vallitalea okinawensis TaxID=2078660 RepID=UPI000CFAB3C1|nr:prepilin-type N-terminal cleavage/methylation domain-containing protein [Vallitalea okinawensis]
MLKIKKNEKGFTLIELITVMALIAIVGTLILRLISFGGQQFHNISDAIGGRSEGNFALNFITTEIKRNDVSNAIALRTKSGNDILEIKSENEFSVSNNLYQYQWIYFKDNSVYHQFSDNSFEISFDLDDTSRTYSLTYDNKIKSLKFEEEPDGETYPDSIKVTVEYYINDSADFESNSILIPIKSDH